jgi:RNA polymerase sigma factor (sigma-70 family)
MAVLISDRLPEGSDRLLDAESDDQLVSMALAGNEAAFAAIVRRYQRELQAQARRLTTDGRGEDAVQQAFLNAFAALQGGGEVRHLRGWLHRILRNEIARARVPVDAPLDAARSYGEPLEDTVERRATVHATLAQLSALPDRQRDALLGTAVLGLPRAHVARTMGLSEGAVRQLVHRARLRLRQAASALIPFPLVRLFGAARSGVEVAPDAAVGAGTAASGGLAIKVGALLASGVVATGVAVSHGFPSAHRSAAGARGAGHQPAHAYARGHGAPAAAPSGAPSDPVTVANTARLREHGPGAPSERGRSHIGPGRLTGTRSGRHHESGGGREDDGSSGRLGDDGGRSWGGTARGGHDGGSSDAGSRSGSGSGTTGSRGSTGSGSDDGGGTTSGGDGSGVSGGGGGGGSSLDGNASTDSSSGTSGSTSGTSGTSSDPSATTTSDGGSGGGGTDGGGGSLDGGGGSLDGGGKTFSGSRDVSGSLRSSSS